ncbi:hypothetical protein AAG906_014647 [Vitis piasezkii]
MEPSASHMNELFPILERVPMDMTIDPQWNFMACVPHGTVDETIEAIMHLTDYLAMQMMEEHHTHCLAQVILLALSGINYLRPFGLSP